MINSSISAKNEPYQIERNSLGDIIVMEPTWSETGRCNFDIATELGTWNKVKKLGYAFDSSAGFSLPIAPYVLLMQPL